MLIIYAFALLWQPEIPHGYYAVTIQDTHFSFKLNTFAPYMLSFIGFWTLAIMIQVKVSLERLLAVSTFGLTTLVFSFYLSYGFTSYPSLELLHGRNYSPRILSISIIVLRVLVVSVLILLFFQWNRNRTVQLTSDF
jgi:hypothetical protein